MERNRGDLGYRCFHPLEDPEAALAAGRLSFRLKGKRLKGEFTLALLSGKDNRKHWLLMKRKMRMRSIPGKSAPL